MKENFERFISCKSTIDDIHVRLRKAEGDYGDGAGGASTADMVAAVTDVGSLTYAVNVVADLALVQDLRTL